MEVTVKLFGTLRRLSHKETPGLWKGDIPPKTRIIDLFQILGTGTSIQEVSAAAINGVHCVSFDMEIPESAEVMLVTPIGGG